MDSRLYGRWHKALMRTLRAARVEKEWNQEPLSKRLKRSTSYINKIEKGSRGLDMLEYFEWCETLGYDPVKMMERIVANFKETK